jgi:hypothetical protein
MEEVDAWFVGEEALRLRDRVGLSDKRVKSGEDGAGVLAAMGSSTMYMGVSKSRNSTHNR